MLVGGLGGFVSVVKVGYSEQVRWVSLNPLMCALLILRTQKGCWFYCFLFLRMSWITAAVRSVAGGRLTKAASLLSATLRFADTLGCSDWSCAIEII